MAKAKGPRKVRRYENKFEVKAVKLSQLPGVQFKDGGFYRYPALHAVQVSQQLRDRVLTA